MQADSSLATVALEIMNTLVGWLLVPVIVALLAVVAFSLWELGQAVAERGMTVRRLVATGRADLLGQRGQRSIDRADLLARIGPMLGLMGTLIPLGPGLAALANGQLDVLAQAVTVAFNTTVLGLLVGILGFLLGRVRRRWYDAAIVELESRR